MSSVHSISYYRNKERYLVFSMFKFKPNTSKFYKYKKFSNVLSSFYIFQFLCDLLHFTFLKGMTKHQYRRPSRTCWVEHQETALKTSNKNLPILIGFCNHQIQSPHNNSIVQIVPKLKGYLSNVAKSELVISDSAKHVVHFYTHSLK